MEKKFKFSARLTVSSLFW